MMRMKLWLIPMIYAAVTKLAGFTVPRLQAYYLPVRHTVISTSAAQTYLCTAASGMMALTGIVFSIAFVMVQFSAVAYSPRLVVLLGRDRTLYHAMGVFIATFPTAWRPFSGPTAAARTRCLTIRSESCSPCCLSA
jgi:uncharacterized membrane protein